MTAADALMMAREFQGIEKRERENVSSLCGLYPSEAIADIFERLEVRRSAVVALLLAAREDALEEERMELTAAASDLVDASARTF